MLLALSACGSTAATSTIDTTITTITTSTNSATSTSTTADATGAPPTSGAPTTTSATSTGSTGDATTFLFIMVPDHPDSWCDVFAQDCPAGQKCSFISDRPHFNGDVEQRCVPLAPNPAGPDELCHFNDPGVGIDDCALGSFCMPYNSDGAGASVCVEICGGDLNHPTCPEKHSCVIPEGGLVWCAFQCDALAQDCHAGLACHLGNCYPVSPGSFELPPGAPCTDRACAPKSTCVPAVLVPDCADELCCTELCDLQAPSSCALEGQTCQPPPPEFDISPVVPDNVGLCQQP